MKKLLYSGLTALMLLFAFGTAKADNAKVKVELNRTTWAFGSTTSTPQFTVTITQATTESGAETREGELALGASEGNVAVKVTLTKDGTTKEQVITSSPVALTTTDLTAGTWTLSYDFVKGEDHDATFENVDNDASTASLTIVNRVPVSLSANTWDGTTAEALPKFTVAATDGITFGNAEGNVAVKVNFYKMEAYPEVTFDQFIEAAGETAIANPDNKLTEGVWMLSYSLVKGDDHTTDFVEDGVDVAEANMQLTVGDVASVIATISFMPAKWTIGSEDGVMYSCSLSSETMSMGTEETDVAVMVTFTKGETIKNKLFTKTFEEFNPSTDLGLTAGVWNLSYKFVKGNSTVENFVELTNIAAENAPATLTIEETPEIELICQVMGPVGKNWPVNLSIESDNEEVDFGAYDVYYTLDGTAPSKTSLKVSGTGYDEDEQVWNYATVRFTESCTFKAIAYVSYNDIEIASDPIEETITIFNGIPTPEFPVPAGDVASGTVLKLTLPEVEIPGVGGGPGVGPMTYDGNKVACDAFYTLDGTEPDVYAATIGAYLGMETTTQQYMARTGIEIEGEVGNEITVKVAYAYVDRETQMGYPSEVATAKYTIIAGIPAPEIDPFSGEVSVGDDVYITSNADEIYYSVNAEETLTVANGTKLENNYIKITAEMVQGGSVKIQALAVEKGADGAEDVVSAVATANLTIKAPVTITFDPATGAEVEVGDKITLTPSREVEGMLYRWYASQQEAEETAWNDEGAGYYSDGEPTVAADKLVLKVAYAEKGADETTDNYFYAIYTLKGSTPVDPDKLDVKIEFMTDAYGQARFAKKSDKIRLYMEDPDAVDSMMYAVVAIDADGEETAAPTYAKYGEDLISLADVEGNFRVKAYAKKDTKTSDVFNADYVLLDIINPTLTFDTMTGKNYPVAFDVRSISYPDIMEKDMYVYYSVDGTTEPSDTAFLNGNIALKYVNKEEGIWKNYLNLKENTTVWAKAYVLLDEGANLVMETPAVKQLVKMNALSNPVITPAVAATEYNAGDSIKVAIEAPEDADMVYYTVDGSEPLYSRLVENENLLDSIIFVYTPSWGDFDTIVVKKSTTVKAIAYKEPAYRPFVPAAGSDIVSATYGFKATLSFNPTSGSTVEEGTKVAITSEDKTIDIFYMMFESEEAAKAAEWDQEKAESYNDELQPILTLKKNTIKAAYARHGAEAIVENYFYATYTVTELPDITLTFNPASGSEVKDSTEITVTASRTTEIFYLVYADSAASVADTLFDRNAKEVAEDGKPMITKGNTFLKCAVYNKGEMKYFYASYTVKEEGSTANEAAELAGVNVYPNPNAGTFNVAVPERARIDIFGLNGAKVMSREVNAGVEAFNLDHSGIYFIRVMAGNKTAVKRVVVR